MAKIVGGTAVSSMLVPDWNQTNPNKADYIKNKPDVANALDGIKLQTYGDPAMLSDVSLVEHEMFVSTYGNKEIFKYTNNYVSYPHEHGIGENVTNNGVTFVDNGDNTITANGTNSGGGTTNYYPLGLKKELKSPLPTGSYILYGCGKDGKAYSTDEPFKVILTLWDVDGDKQQVVCNRASRNVKFTIKKPVEKIQFRIQVMQGVSVTKQKFYTLLFNEDTGKKYIADTEVDATNGIYCARVPSSCIYNAVGMAVSSPETYIFTKDNSLFSVVYNRDINKVIANLENAIISLGGNV